MEFCRDGETFEVDMGKDKFKILLKVNRLYPYHVIKKIADGIKDNKVIILPPDIDVLVVVNDGSVEKY